MSSPTPGSVPSPAAPSSVGEIPEINRLPTFPAFLRGHARPIHESGTRTAFATRALARAERRVPIMTGSVIEGGGPRRSPEGRGGRLIPRKPPLSLAKITTVVQLMSSASTPTSPAPRCRQGSSPSRRRSHFEVASPDAAGTGSGRGPSVSPRVASAARGGRETRREAARRTEPGTPQVTHCPSPQPGHRQLLGAICCRCSPGSSGWPAPSSTMCGYRGRSPNPPARTPGRVRQGMAGLLAAIGTPAPPPKPRGKAPGWPAGRVRKRRERYEVVKKASKKPQAAA